MKNKMDQYSTGFNTETLERNEAAAQKRFHDLDKMDYSFPEITIDDEMRAAIEYFNYRTDAISNYKNDLFVEDSIEALIMQFEERMNKGLDEHLQTLYQDLINDTRYIIEQKRKYKSYQIKR